MGQKKDGKLTEAGAKFLDRNSDSLPNLFLNRGEILFNRTNSYALVGKAALYEGNDDCRTFASYLIRFKPHHQLIDAQFISLYLNSRSEDRSVGKECVSTCSSRWLQVQS